MLEAKNSQKTDLEKLGEFGLIDHLTKDLPQSQSSTVLSIGDDAAVLDHQGYQTVLTTDMLVEGVHFDLAYMPLQHLGYKAVVVNLSDVYAMNATATQITISLAISNRFSLEALEAFYDGVRHAAAHYGVDVVGGDTTSSTKGMIISITALGTVVPAKITKRSGAKENDLLVVSGDLGGAYMGFRFWKERRLFMR